MTDTSAIQQDRPAEATVARLARVYTREPFNLTLVDLLPGSKESYTKDWNAPGAGYRDPEEAARHFSEHPDHNVGCLHSESHTAALDLDHSEAERVLALVGVNLDAVMGAASLVVQGDPTHPAKPFFRLPAGISLKPRKLSWPNPEPGPKARPVTIFELRAGPVQDVLPPSVHPDTKKPYLMMKYPKRGETLAELPAPLLDLWQHWDELLPTMQAACPWAPAAPVKSTHHAPQRQDRDTGDAWDRVREEIRGRLSCEELLSRHGHAPVRGRRYLCPFHDETAPSFWLFAEGAAWCCGHGSAPAGTATAAGHSTGDVIDLEAYFSGRTVGEATADLARELGIVLPHSKERPPTVEREEWPPPEALPAPEPVPTLPPELVPRPLRGWLVDAAERASIPLEMVAAPAIVVLGSLVGHSLGIRPEGARNPWAVVPNLWGGIVAPPGLLKTHCVGEALAPLQPLEDAAAEECARAKELAEVEKLALQAELARLKSAAKGGFDRAEAARILKELRAIEPVEKRYATSDATIEKLGEILVGNSRGILLKRDELGGWLSSFNRAGHESDRDFFLEGWEGKQGYTVDRIGRGTIRIPVLCISVVGAIPPARLLSYVTETLDEGGADGLLQRFQMIVWPDSLPDYHRTTGNPDLLARSRAFTVYRALDNLNVANLGAVQEGPGSVPYLQFDPSAQELFDAWRSELEAHVRGAELQTTPAFCSHLAKYRSLMPSLALLFHLIETVGGPASNPAGVPTSAASLAAAWCDYLEAHARKVYRRELAGDTEGARLLAAKIEAGDVRDGQAVRELYRPQWAGLKNPDDVWQAVGTLEHLGWLRVAEVMTGGRTKYTVHLHPELKGGTR
jgi:hypothetical protein